MNNEQKNAKIVERQEKTKEKDYSNIIPQKFTIKENHRQKMWIKIKMVKDLYQAEVKMMTMIVVPKWGRG